MIKERYCSYKISRLLQEKGFNEPCRSIYVDCGDYVDFYYTKKEQTDLQIGAFEVLRPTHQMAMDWLRKEHYIYADPIKQGNYNDCSEYYSWIVARMGIIHRNSTVVDKLSYEEAVEAALKYSLTELI